MSDDQQMRPTREIARVTLVASAAATALSPARRAFRAFAPALALGVAGLAVACADAPTSPTPAAAPSRGPAQQLLSTSSSMVGDTTVVAFTIDPTSPTTFVVIGTHKVQIGANAVCDPATSGYGASYWNAPCTPLRSNITVTARAWTLPNGHPQVSFSPDIRFVPGSVNSLTLMDKSASWALSGAVVWCPTGGSACVNESLNDPSVATVKGGGGYTRPLKHLSGYTVVLD